MKLTINEKEYTLEYDFNARVKAEQVTGINLFAVQQTDAATARALTWSMLLPHHPEMTIEDAGRLLNPKTQTQVLAAITKLSKSEDE